MSITMQHLDELFHEMLAVGRSMAECAVGRGIFGSLQTQKQRTEANSNSTLIWHFRKW